MKRIKWSVLALMVGVSAGAMAQSTRGWGNNGQSVQYGQPVAATSPVTMYPLSPAEINRIENERRNQANMQAANVQAERERIAREQQALQAARARQAIEHTYNQRRSYDDEYRNFGQQVAQDRELRRMSKREWIAYRNWRNQQMAMYQRGNYRYDHLSPRERAFMHIAQRQGEVFSISFRN